MVFLTIMLLSMFPEDTLETQAGATLFAFLMALLLMANGRCGRVRARRRRHCEVALP